MARMKFPKLYACNADANFWVIIIKFYLQTRYHVTRTSCFSTERLWVQRRCARAINLSCSKSLPLIIDARHRMMPFPANSAAHTEHAGGHYLDACTGGGLQRCVANTHFAVGLLSSQLVVYSARVSVSMSIELQKLACYVHGTWLWGSGKLVEQVHCQPHAHHQSCLNKDIGMVPCSFVCFSCVMNPFFVFRDISKCSSILKKWFLLSTTVRSDSVFAFTRVQEVVV